MSEGKAIKDETFVSRKETFVLILTIIMSLNGEIIRKKIIRQHNVSTTLIDGVIKETFDHKFHIQVIKKVDLMKFFFASSPLFVF